MENYEMNSDCGEGEDGEEVGSSVDGSEEEEEEDEENLDSSLEGDESEDESDHADGTDNIDEKIEQQLVNSKSRFSSVSIDLSHTPTSLRCSPKDNIACVATINGDLTFVKFDQAVIECVAQVECYKEESCVDIDFSKSGDTLYTICGQYELVMVDVNSRQMHNFGNLCNDDENTNLTNIKCINHWYFCTGDNKGQVKIWDSRHIKPFKETGFLRRSSDEVNDYVSDMIVNKDGNRIATASGAGVVTVFDTRKLNIINQNGESKSDLTSLASVSNDRELVAGSLRGDLVFTSWQGSQHKSHIFNALHNVACNNIKAVTERLIVTSWDDNFIRLFGIYPHKFQGFVGLTTFPAEFLDIDSHKKSLLSSGFDKKLWLWDVQDLERKAKKSSTKQILLKENNFFCHL